MTKHILIIDDCEDVRFLLSLKLTNLGFKVSEAKDGVDAYEFLADEAHDKVDLILLDIMMPNMDAEEFLTTLSSKSSPVHNHQYKIACITAHFDEDINQKYIELGAIDVIKKPIKGNELDKKIKSILCTQ